MPLPAWLVPAAAAAVGLIGSERTNESNRKEAARNRDFQSREAAINRGFQERMRNSEWQAAVEDMRRAGINPAVAYSRGGASSPSGSMASGSLAAPAHDSAGAGLSSAMQSVRLRQEMKMMGESIRKVEAEARAAAALADREEARNLAYGFKRRPDGSVEIDFSMPGIVEETQAGIRQRIADAARAASMSEIAGVGGQVAQGFGEVMPGFQRIMAVAGQGADQLAGVVEFMERVARMRDDAVQAYLGMPKKAVQGLLNALKRAQARGRN